MDNDTHRIESVRLGVPGALPAGTSGTLFFDAFESRRSTYIGQAGMRLHYLGKSMPKAGLMKIIAVLPDVAGRYAPLQEEVLLDAPTDYLFNGKHYEQELGLYWFESRWFDPRLSRWIQPDTIIPETYNPPAYDRYQYVYSNPLRYKDPSGHKICEGYDCDFAYDRPRPKFSSYYNITFKGDWSNKDKETIEEAVKLIALKFSEKLGISPWRAFRAVYGKMTFEHVDYSCPEGCWGRAISAQEIRFYGPSSGKLDPRLVIHELGHSFNARVVNGAGVDNSPYKMLGDKWRDDPNFPRRADVPNGFYNNGAGGWTQSKEPDEGNEFADMFIGWAYERWQSSESGGRRDSWMKAQMPLWIDMVSKAGQ